MSTSHENSLAGLFASPQEQRERLLEHIIDRYRIAPETDSSDPELRYVAILDAVIDGETSAADSFDDLEAAKEYLAGAVGEYDYPRMPLMVIDLDTGRCYQPHIRVSIDLTEPPAQPDWAVALAE